MTISKPKNILVIRNDKLGDFMLTWPALSLLKKQYPDSKITVLVPPYTEPMAKLCPWIDNVLLDDQHKSLFSDVLTLTHKIRKNNFDISISLFTETRTAAATFLSRIPCRIAPATKLAQFFSNKRLRQRRSESSKPEYKYNTDLVKFFVKLQGGTPIQPQQPPYLRFDAATTQNMRSQYIQERNISTDSRLIIVHPGTGGSALNFSVEQYSELIKCIAEQIDAYFIITAGPGEDEIVEDLSSLLPEVDHNVYISTQGLVSFSQFIAMCDLFISGSTGTLHIAGALDIPTAAFYPARKSATPLRWQTLNQASRRITFSPEKHTGTNDMQTIKPVNCARQITTFLQQLHR